MLPAPGGPARSLRERDSRGGCPHTFKIHLSLLARIRGACCWAGLCCFELVADRVAGKDQLHAAVLLAAFGGVIACDRGRLAVAVRFHGIRRNSLLYEVVADSLCAQL